jgi:uncharacterized membrane protein YidH (DUF202 family)
MQVPDAGLQAERTALSWTRTGVAVLVNALLALRSGWFSHDAPIIVLASALVVAAGAVFWLGASRRRTLLQGQGPIAPPTRVVAAAAAITLVACMTGLAAVVMRHDLGTGPYALR